MGKQSTFFFRVSYEYETWRDSSFIGGDEFRYRSTSGSWSSLNVEFIRAIEIIEFKVEMSLPKIIYNKMSSRCIDNTRSFEIEYFYSIDLYIYMLLLFVTNITSIFFLERVITDYPHSWCMLILITTSMNNYYKTPSDFVNFLIVLNCTFVHCNEQLKSEESTAPVGCSAIIRVRVPGSGSESYELYVILSLCYSSVAFGCSRG